MANQAIALGARAPQTDILGGAIQRNAQLMNMMAQQRAAERQGAMAQQEMQLKQQLAVPQQAKAQSEAQSAQLKYVTDFLNTSALALSNVRNADEAHNVAQILHQHFPDMDQAIAQTMSSIPQNPADFDAWRQRTLYQTMDAKEQLKQKFIDITTGDQTYTMAAPEYAGSGMPTAEVPGTRVKAPQGITYVKDDMGVIRPMPTKTTGSETPGLVGGPRGGVAGALQTNPGALKDSAFAKSQPGYTGASGGFATFATPEAGIAAQEALLRGSYVNKGYNTIDKIVNRYAPPGPENSAASVSNYKKYIAGQTGIDINQPITAAQVPAVAKAMREFETGQRPGSGGAGGVQFGQPLEGTDIMLRQAEAKARTAAGAAGSKYDKMIRNAEELLKHPSLDTIVGNIQGNLPETALEVSSQDAADALNLYRTLLVQGGFAELQALRDASPTGGALGQVSDRENAMLQQAAGALGRSQSEALFKQHVREFIAQLKASKARVEQAYAEQFGKPFSAGAGAAPSAAPKRLKFNPATGDFE